MTAFHTSPPLRPLPCCRHCDNTLPFRYATFLHLAVAIFFAAFGTHYRTFAAALVPNARVLTPLHCGSLRVLRLQPSVAITAGFILVTPPAHSCLDVICSSVLRVDDARLSPLSTPGYRDQPCSTFPDTVDCRVKDILPLPAWLLVLACPLFCLTGALFPTRPYRVPDHASSRPCAFAITPGVVNRVATPVTRMGLPAAGFALPCTPLPQPPRTHATCVIYG